MLDENHRITFNHYDLHSEILSKFLSNINYQFVCQRWIQESMQLMNSVNKKKIKIKIGGSWPKDECVSTTIVYCKKLFLFVVSVNGNH